MVKFLEAGKRQGDRASSELRDKESVWHQASVVWSKRSLAIASLHLEEAARCESLNLPSSPPSPASPMAPDQKSRQNPEAS